MRRIGVLLLVLLSAGFLSAQSLSVERARKLVEGKTELAYVAGSISSPDFCVFNKVSQQGFVIVSPDAVFGDGLVLAYSDEGSFDYESLPENAKWVLSQYQEQINYIRENNIMMASNTSSASGHVIVAPLLAEAHWAQSYPFNEMCPVDGREKSVTGCVATAMAQIMWYYKWPLSGTGSHSYKWNGKTLSVDYSKSVYDWSRMPGKYISGRYGQDEVDAVSRLMYDCGVAVEMDYSASGSGAYSYDVQNALKKYFKYKSASYAYRYGSSSNWNTRMKNELDKRHPLYMSGVSSEGGHAFVCDGYDSNDYFHYNFGWGGSGNGYYLSTVAGGFSEGQEMVYEIRPDREKLLYDGLYYNQLCEDKVELSYPDSDDEYYSGRIVLPAEIAGGSQTYGVTAIGAYAFASSDVSVIDIPASVRTIAGNSMFGCDKIDTIYVHWTEPLDCDVSVFDNAVYSKSVLVVPDGRLNTYSKCMPWSLFSNIVDASGSAEVCEWSDWELVDESYSTYKYSWKELAPESEDVTVYIRTSATFLPKVQYKVDNWFSSSLIIDVDTLSGQCQIAKQSTGIVNVDDEILACDYPTYDRRYTYQLYPCKFDKEMGTFSMNLVFFSSAGGYYFMGRDSLYLAGYPVFDVSIGDVSVDKSGKVSCEVDFSDAAGCGYVFLHGNLSSKQVSSAYSDIKSGKIELEYTTESSFVSQLAESDAYTLVVASVNSGGQLVKFASKHLSYIANESDWVDEYVGSYYYQAWKKMTQNNVHLLHDKNNPRYWKLSSLYNGSELVFRWYDDDTLEFDEQPSGFSTSSVPVNISDNKYSDKPQKKGSYYDSSRNTLYFDTYYSSPTSKKNNAEAFVIEVPTLIENVRTDIGAKPQIFNIYGHRLETPQKGLNIIDGQKVFVE